MNDRECLRTPTNVWRSFCDHCDWWRIAFVSPFVLYLPLSGEFAANMFFYIRKDIRHSVRAAIRATYSLNTFVTFSPWRSRGDVRHLPVDIVFDIYRGDSLVLGSWHHWNCAHRGVHKYSVAKKLVSLFQQQVWAFQPAFLSMTQNRNK